MDEPLPEAAEKLSAPAQPTVPLGADFGKCSHGVKASVLMSWLL